MNGYCESYHKPVIQLLHSVHQFPSYNHCVLMVDACMQRMAASRLQELQQQKMLKM